MNKQELINELKRQLALLENEGEYKATQFDVWSIMKEDLELIGESLVRLERKSWSWGSCVSDTCNHNSHDPFAEGDRLYILAKQIGKTERNQEFYSLPNGRLIYYEWEDRGHYAPFISLMIE